MAKDYFVDTIRGATSAATRARDGGYGSEGFTSEQWTQLRKALGGLAFALADLLRELRLEDATPGGVKVHHSAPMADEIAEHLRQVGRAAR